MSRTRYAVLGTGSRARMYLDAIVGPHADVAELVAWSDSNPGRLDSYQELLFAGAAEAPQRFAPVELAMAIKQLGIDRVIITAPDYTHAESIAAALAAGADVVVEKPLTTDEPGVRLIAGAASKSNHDVLLTFNYRYAPRNSGLKEVIKGGEIGEVTSVHFEWLLDTYHGADYFRRWHRYKELSGGLLIHKSSHHFDLVNWWLEDTPVRVFASGGLRFYGAANARKRGLGARPQRGSVDDDRRDRFSLDMRLDPELKRLYLDQESHDGYLRDRDVFDEGITIEDNLSLVVDYGAGSSMSYTLSTHGPWEGYTVYVNGTLGRAELTVVERGAVLFDAEGRFIVDPSAHPLGAAADEVRPTSERLVVQRQFEPAEVVPLAKGDSGHGGGDELLLRDVFRGVTDDPLGRAANWLDGVRSMAVGLAGNRSLETGQAVRIDELALGLGS